MRGEFNDFNPWQVPMGSITEPVLKLAASRPTGSNARRMSSRSESACRMAFGGGNMQVAILLSQRMTDRNQAGGPLRWTAAHSSPAS